MQKTVIAAALALMVGTAVAGTTVTIDGQNTTNDGPISRQYSVDVKAPLGNSDLTIDGLVQTERQDNTSKHENRIEGGLGIQTPGTLGLYARGAVGEKYPSAADSFAYYSVEGGLVWKTPATNLTTSLGYRFRDAFQENKADRSDTGILNVGYALTKNDTIGARFEKTYGDGKQNAYAVYVGHTF